MINNFITVNKKNTKIKKNNLLFIVRKYIEHKKSLNRKLSYFFVIIKVLVIIIKWIIVKKD